MDFCRVDLPDSQCSRRDVKRNLKACANVTCNETVSLDVMSHEHVRGLRAAKPL